MEHLELISDVRYRFHSGRFCELQWTNCFDTGKEINVLYLILQKAFSYAIDLQI